MEFPPVRKTIDGTTAYFYRDERMMVTVGDRVYGHPFYDSVGTDGEEIRTLLTEREHAALIFESTTLMFEYEAFSEFGASLGILDGRTIGQTETWIFVQWSLEVLPPRANPARRLNF